MLKMQKIPNLFLLVGRDDQLVYFNHVFTLWEDQIENGGATRSNMQKLLDIELIFGLHYILPFLELVDMLIKYAQGQDVYICDFVEAIKMCKSKMYELYNDLEGETFNGFHNLL